MWETTFARNSHAGFGKPFYEPNILPSMVFGLKVLTKSGVAISRKCCFPHGKLPQFRRRLSKRCSYGHETHFGGQNEQSRFGGAGRKSRRRVPRIPLFDKPAFSRFSQNISTAIRGLPSRGHCDAGPNRHWTTLWHPNQYHLDGIYCAESLMMCRSRIANTMIFCNKFACYGSQTKIFGTSKNSRARHFVSTFHRF